MKTKFIHIVPAIIWAAVLSAGCSKDFLNISPQSTLNSNNFFQSEKEVEQAVNGAYSALHPLGLVSLWLFGEVRSDNTTIQYNTQNRSLFVMENIDQFLADANLAAIRSFWEYSYIGIARCNDVLDNIDKVSDMPEAARNQYTGEVKFLRSFHYFNLVRQFGGVPLRLTPVKSASEVKSDGRATIEQLYDQIIADLTEAAEKLPASYPTSQRGRATRGTALTLLAKVHLTQSRFDLALTELRKVTGLGYSLLNDYQEIFNPANKNHSESIFEIQYLGAQPELSSNFMYSFVPFNSGSLITGDPATPISPVQSTSGMNIPTRDMIQAYEPGDLRKDVSLAEGYLKNGSFIDEPYVKKYIWGFTEPGRTNVNFPVLRYADVLLMLAECLNEGGFPNTEAFDLLNTVRSRADLPAKTAGNPDPALNIATQEEFRAAIFQERRVELAFENHRWYDLVRSGKAIEVMNAHGIDEKSQHANIPATAFNVTADKLLLPIPQIDVTLDNLDQNP